MIIVFNFIFVLLFLFSAQESSLSFNSKHSSVKVHTASRIIYYDYLTFLRGARTNLEMKYSEIEIEIENKGSIDRSSSKIYVINNQKFGSYSYFDENYVNDHNDFFLSHLSTSYTRNLVIILVGIPGSGKSTIARAIASTFRSDNRTWEVVNQDTLKSRQQVLIRARLALEKKKSVIIDRCNIDCSQRQHWISLARDYNAHPLCVMVPNCLNIAECVSRAILRGDDGFHPADTNWHKVCRSMGKAFQRPELAEGLDAIYCCDGQEDALDKLMTVMADI